MRSIRRVITSICLLITTALLVLAATQLNSLFFSFYPKLSRAAIGFLAGLTAPIPYAVWEILLIVLILWFLVSLFVDICKGKILQWLSGLLLGASLAVFLFMGLWGLNYFAPSMASRLDLPESKYTAAELREATEYYRDRANEAALLVERDAEGVMVAGDFDELAKAAGDGFTVLAEDMDCFSGSTVRVKHLLSSKLMGANGTTGVFIAFTGESGVSSTTFSASVPFTMCHEIGHRMAFAREDEANFAAFLGCMANERDDFRYSGYNQAFVYCYNALYKVDPEGAAEVMAGANEALRTDLKASIAHYDALEDETASEVQTKVYDAYLKTFAVESGVQSYGEVVDLLTPWYFEALK